MKKQLQSEDLHDILDEVLEGLRDGTLKEKTAKEISNAAGKKISLAKSQIDYASMWGGQVAIPFFSDNPVIGGKHS